MRLNADFTQRVVVRPQDHIWVASPAAGVTRMMLDRVGDEVARASSLVRFAPGTRFTPHAHWGGEEIFVIDGTFQDEHGSYPAGSWLRSPHQSRHQPWSDEGCLIYVKTGHLHPDSLRLPA